MGIKRKSTHFKQYGKILAFDTEIGLVGCDFHVTLFFVELKKLKLKKH